jgi:Na+/proline symporter
MMSIQVLVGIVALPSAMGNSAAGKTELEGRVGYTVGTFIKRFCTVAWCLTGLAAVAYYADRPLTDPDQVFGYVAREFLPRVTHGLLGVFIASLLASVMSSCDAFMVASSALFTENVYRPLRPQRDERHYVLVGRITAAVVVTGGVVFAYWLPGVVQGLEIFWKIPAMMGIAFWLGLFWRRTTVAGAWASTMTGFVVWWLTTQAWGIAWLGGLPMAEGLRFVVDGAKGPEVYLPWQMTFYLSAGLIAGIVVSLFTKPVASEKLAAFYALVRTPVQPDEESEVPCTLPPGVEPAERRELFPGTDLTVYLPSRTSMLGFFGGWIAVALIIYSVVLIARV